MVLAGLLVALIPATAHADDTSDNHGGFAMRVNGDYTVPAGETVSIGSARHE